MTREGVFNLDTEKKKSMLIHLTLLECFILWANPRLLDSADLKSRLLKGGFTFAFQWNIKHTPHKKGEFLTLESGDVVRRKS